MEKPRSISKRFFLLFAVAFLTSSRLLIRLSKSVDDAMISLMDSIASELSSSVCINTLVMPMIPYSF